VGLPSDQPPLLTFVTKSSTIDIAKAGISRQGVRMGEMDKAEFIKSAPMYYALAIAVAFMSVSNDGYLSEQSIKNEYSAEDGDGDHFNYLATDPLFIEGIAILAKSQIIEIVPDRFGPPLFKRDAAFDDNFIKLCQDTSSPFFKYSRLGRGGRLWLSGALLSVNHAYLSLGIKPGDFKDPLLQLEALFLDNLDETQEQIPLESSDQDWEPLPLDRTDEKLQAAIERLDETVEQLRSDNGYAATHPEEKSYVLDKLQAVTRRLKEDTQISVKYLKDYAFEPLGILIKSFGKAAIGIFAEGAKTALIEWLKREGINILEKFFGN
jgi:hypothetical protein